MKTFIITTALVFGVAVSSPAIARDDVQCEVLAGISYVAAQHKQHGNSIVEAVTAFEDHIKEKTGRHANDVLTDKEVYEVGVAIKFAYQHVPNDPDKVKKNFYKACQIPGLFF